MNTLTQNISTFWDTINDYTIVIPQIQRDYAQGRIDADTEGIRINLLDKFQKAISKESDPIDIDFIYGYIDTHNKSFVPLDGQQRLTTLFLIHWYLAKRSSVDTSLLTKFRYETRQSSTDFCKALLTSTISFEKENLQSFIKDQRWFYHSWKKDPTISAMLTMIQAIHSTFKDRNYEQLWENLKNQSITFNFLKIDDFGLNDDLYIKMNSRGKALTRFENFKVWFQKRNPNETDWKSKIDNEWTNLFWNYREAYNTGNIVDNDTMDNEFMQFINGMIMFDLGLKGDEREVKFFSDNHDIALLRYEQLKCFSVANEIKNITHTLDWLYKNDSKLSSILDDIYFWQSKPIFETFISNKPTKATYKERVLFYSIVIFANNIDLSQDLPIETFRQWTRVTRNLIENTVIDSPERFNSAIKSLDAIKNSCVNIYDYISKTENKISFFSIQADEERIKANLILSNPSWEKELLDAENHELFRGCISFLLPNKENEDINTFIKYRDIAIKIFVKEGSIPIYKTPYLLMRATLAKSRIKQDIRLLDNGENWRELLKKEDIKQAIYSVLADFEDKSANEYLGILEQIIEQYTDKSILWKYYIIKNKVLLASDASRSKFVKNYNNWGDHYLFNNEGGNWINNDNQFLLSNFRNELITLLRINNPDIDLWEGRAMGWWLKVDDISKNAFYRGEHIWLRKIIENYRLRLQFKTRELVVGFHSDEKGLIKVEENNFDKITGWLIAKNYSYPEKEADFENWMNAVLADISVIEKLVSPKI